MVLNKEFLEANYPRGSPDSYRDIEVFSSFHFDLKVKNQNSVVLLFKISAIRCVGLFKITSKKTPTGQYYSNSECSRIWLQTNFLKLI